MRKRDSCLLTLAHVVSAALFFLFAWLCLGNFCRVTETWEIENSFQKLSRETDYRFYQFVRPMGQVQVEVEGGETPAVVRIEKAGYGTVVMVEGYQVSEEHPQTITIRYRLNPLRMKSKLPSLESYTEWVEEFHSASLANMMRSDMRISGKSTILRATDLEPELDMRLGPFIGCLMGTMSGIMTLIFGCFYFRLRHTDSSSYAMEQLEQLSQEMEKEKKRKAVALAARYSHRYQLTLEVTLLLYLLLTFGLAVLILTAGNAAKGSLALVFVMIVVTLLIMTRIQQVLFRQFSRILTEECQPYATVIAYLDPFGKRRRFRVKRWHYNYMTMITLGFYYMGRFEAACSHLEIVWEEMPACLKKSLFQIHYQALRIYCLRELNRMEEAEAEQEALEEFLRKHPRWERSSEATNYRVQETILQWMTEGRVEEARTLLLERANTDQPVYIQVSAHYLLWKLACDLEDREEIELHRDFITQYGKDMFYYERIKGE